MVDIGRLVSRIHDQYFMRFMEYIVNAIPLVHLSSSIGFCFTLVFICLTASLNIGEAHDTEILNRGFIAAACLQE